MDALAFGISLAVSLGIFMFLILAFLILSRKPSHHPVFYTAMILKPRRRVIIINPEDLPQRSWFQWLKEAWLASEQDLVVDAGLDAVVYIQTLESAFVILFFSAILICPALLSITSRSSGYEQQLQGFKNYVEPEVLDKLSMGNIPNQSKRIWVFAAGAYWLSIISYLVLWEKYRRISRLRSNVLASPDRLSAPDHFTALVRDIPDNREETVNKKFNTLHRGRYSQCIMVYDLKPVLEVRNSLESTIASLRRVEARYASTGKRPQHQILTGELARNRVDSIDFYRERRDKLLIELNVEQQRTRSERGQAAALVIFTTAVSQDVYSSSSTRSWQVSPAPEPRQVIWENLALPWSQRVMRWVTVQACFVAAIAIYLVAIAVVTGFVALDRLQQAHPSFEFVKHVADNQILRVLIQALVPQFLLELVLGVLLHLVFRLSKFQGFVSISEMYRDGAAKLFYFYVLDIFLTIAIGNSLTETKRMLQHPKDALAILNRSLPTSASFFITVISFSTISLGWRLSRLQPLIRFEYKKRFTCKTDYEIREVLDKEISKSINYAKEVPREMLIIIITFGFSVIAPLVLLFAVPYFAVAWFIARHQALKVDNQAYETHGRMWPHIHNRILASLLVAQVAMISYFNFKKFWHSNIMMFPLPVATLVYGIIAHKLYYPTFTTKPLAGQSPPSMPAPEAVHDIVNAYTPQCLRPFELGGDA